jgi:hypothetical protein
MCISYLIYALFTYGVIAGFVHKTGYAANVNNGCLVQIIVCHYPVHIIVYGRRGLDGRDGGSCTGL